MKKTVFLGLLVVLLALGFIGCDNGNVVSDPIYTVTFNSNGGTAVASINVVQGATVTEPTPPTKTGFEIIFIGWFKDAGLTNEWDFVTDNVTTNITLYAKWIPYELGDTGPGGGIIFYVDPTSFKLYQGTVTNTVNAEADGDTFITAYYLEAWTGNETNTTTWSGTGEATWIDIPLVEQAHYAANPAQWIGYGLRNTRIIITALEAADPIQSGRAAQLAATTKGGFEDWFLPSIDELNAMYIASAEPNNISGLPAGEAFFWSSSQLDSDYAGFLIFNYGAFSARKDNVIFVRAIRAY